MMTHEPQQQGGRAGSMITAHSRRVVRLPAPALAALAVPAATLVYWALGAQWGSTITILIFCPALAAVTLAAGWRWGVVAAALPAALLVSGSLDPRALALYFLVSALVIGLAHALRAAKVRDASEEREWLEREAQLTVALEMCDAGSWELEPDGRIEQRSAVHDRIFGCAAAASAWNLERLLDHVLAPDREAAATRFRHAIESGGELHLECRIRRADGEVRWVRLVGRHVKGAAGPARRMTGIIQDITDHRRTQDRLHRVLETEAIGVLFFDAQGVLIGANEVFLRATGYTREQVERRELDWRAMTPAEWVEASENADAETRRDGPHRSVREGVPARRRQPLLDALHRARARRWDDRGVRDRHR